MRAYPGLSAQVATLMAREPKWLEHNLLCRDSGDFLDSKSVPAGIGERAVVRDCGRILNVSIEPEVTIEGLVADERSCNQQRGTANALPTPEAE